MDCTRRRRRRAARGIFPALTRLPLRRTRSCTVSANPSARLFSPRMLPGTSSPPTPISAMYSGAVATRSAQLGRVLAAERVERIVTFAGCLGLHCGPRRGRGRRSGETRHSVEGARHRAGPGCPAVLPLVSSLPGSFCSSCLSSAHHRGLSGAVLLGVLNADPVGGRSPPITVLTPLTVLHGPPSLVRW